MAGDARLGLADDLDQLADRQLRLSEEQKEAQPGWIARRAQHGEQNIHGPHINISLYVNAIPQKPAAAGVADLRSGTSGPWMWRHLPQTAVKTDAKVDPTGGTCGRSWGA